MTDRTDDTVETIVARIRDEFALLQAEMLAHFDQIALRFDRLERLAGTSQRAVTRALATCRFKPDDFDVQVAEMESIMDSLESPPPR